MAYALAGHVDKSRLALAEYQRYYPDVTVGSFRSLAPVPLNLTSQRYRRQFERLKEGLLLRGCDELTGWTISESLVRVNLVVVGDPSWQLTPHVLAGDAAGSGQESSWLPDHSSREQDRRVCQAEVDQDRRPLA